MSANYTAEGYRNDPSVKSLDRPTEAVFRRSITMRSMVAALSFFSFLAGISVGALANVLSTNPGVVEGARKEGQVTWYFNWSLPDAMAVARQFEKNFPYIRVNTLRSANVALTNRVLNEARAGRHAVDVIVVTDPFWSTLMEAGLIEPYCSQERAAFRDEFKDRGCLWTLLNVNTHVIAYNTKSVTREQAPKNLPDLLDSRWKGALVMDMDDFSWFAAVLDKWGEQKGTTYMNALATQKPHFRHGHTLMLQLVAAGEFSVNVVAYGPLVEREKTKGGPLEWVADEPVTIQGGVVSLASQAPHPNASRIFIDYLMSKEAQEIISRQFNRVATRNDVAANPSRLIAGLKFHPLKMLSKEALNKRAQQYRSIFRVD